ncbi:MAG: sodium transporter, partial [Bacteroidota bacterium]
IATFVAAVGIRRINGTGINAGILAGVGINVYLWLFVPDVFWFWWNAIGCVVTIVVALVVSTIIKREANEGLEVVISPSKKEVTLLLGFFAFIILISLSLPKLLS